MAIRCFIVFACLVVMFTPAFAGPPRALAEGIALVGAGDYNSALEKLSPLATSYPDDSVVRYWLGRACYGQRSYKLAAEHLAIAAGRDGQNRDVCLWYGEALRAIGHTTDAQAIFAASCELHPEDTTLLGEYASTCAIAGDYTGARVAFQQLAKLDPSPATKASVAEWLKVLDGLSKQSQLEPPVSQRTSGFTFCADAEDPAATWVQKEVETARAQVSEAFGMRLVGFRVLLFADNDGYTRYARIFLPEERELHAVAFTLKSTLVILSPTVWASKGDKHDELISTVRHEIAHLAIAQRTEGGQGVPLWLNEGIACLIGGSGGVQTGQAPQPPLTLSQLTDGFLTGDLHRQEQSYSQAYAMASVLMRKLGPDGLLTLLDRLANGVQLPAAYQRISGESFASFLDAWPARMTATRPQ